MVSNGREKTSDATLVLGCCSLLLVWSTHKHRSLAGVITVPCGRVWRLVLRAGGQRVRCRRGPVERDVEERRVRLHHSEILLSGVEPFSVHLEGVEAWKEDAPVLAVLGGLETHVPVPDLHGGALYRVVVLVLHEAPHTPVHLAHVPHQRLLVVLPELGQPVGRRVLAAGHLDGYVHTSVPHVVVVLHPTC